MTLPTPSLPSHPAPYGWTHAPSDCPPPIPVPYDPSLIQAFPSNSLTRTPTASEALDYVSSLFARYGESITLYGTIAPGFETHDSKTIPIPGTRDVLFLLGLHAYRMTVWWEIPANGSPAYLYGEY